VVCSRCGQVVRDGREVVIDHLSLCKPCAEGAYFRNAREVSWPEMNWTPEQRLDSLAGTIYLEGESKDSWSRLDGSRQALG
jgi:hypothetical protein